MNRRLHHSLFFLLCLPLALASWSAKGGDVPFSETKLQELLRMNPATGLPVDSIRELVPLLPTELRENFTFVYDSRSPFRSSISPGYPRVILFTSDARLVLTFIGDEQKAGADLLESISFDDQTATFTLKSYLLPAAERRGTQIPPDAMNCGRCHGADPRPVFDSYPHWPGFYGSVLDTFPRDRIGSEEQQRYRQFLAGAAKTGVYQGLIFPPGSPVSPYLNPRHFRETSIEIDAKILSFEPNTRLGMALTELNRKRIYRKLAAGPDFAAGETELLAELLGCKHSAGPDPNAVRLIEQQLDRQNSERRERLGLRAQDPRLSRDDMQELAFAREIAEIDRVAKRANADRSDWSMALEPGSWALFDGILSGIYDGKSYYLKEDLIFEMLAHLSEREPAFRPYFVVNDAFAGLGRSFGHRISLGDARKSCRLLRRAQAQL